MTRKAIILGMTLLWGWPVAVRAQNAISGQNLEVHATFHNVGITVTVTGDDNTNATAALEINIAGGGFAVAHPLSRIAADRFVGSAFFLDPDTAYEVRVILDDPDGVTNGTLTGQGVTRNIEVPVSSGNTYHVSPTGNDNNDGSQGSPFATVLRGLQEAQPGDTVLVHGGVYHEEVDVPRGGTPGSPITLRAAGDGPAVMDGADPALRDPGAWTDDGGHVYSAPSVETRYVSVDGVRLWRYESLSDLQNLAVGTNGGFYFDGSRIHVRLPYDAAPAGHEIQVSVFGRALWLEGTPHVVIDGLTIRCYGSEQYSQGAMVRDGSHNVWIVNSVFENVMPGIWVKNDVSDLTIMSNNFSDMGLAEFPWYEVKAQGGMEAGAITIDNEYDGQGIVFYNNVVHDSFDGLGICGDSPMGQPNNADVIGNLIHHLGDDGIETDGTCSNIRILSNRFEDALVGVSVAPSVGGPTYVIRNLMVDLKNVSPDTDWMTRAMKFNVGDSRPSGPIFAYHNTAVTYEPDQPAFGVTDDSIWTYVVVGNNIWVGTDYGFYYQNSGDEPFFHNYDLIHSTGSRLIRYQGNNYDTVADYFGATGQCEHCLEGDPMFIDGPGGDYALTAGSPAIDNGIPIVGVNDDFLDNGPDMGALEFGAVVPPLPDAGIRPDAGPPLPDGSTTTNGGSGKSGCGCRNTGPAPGGGRVLVMLMLLGLGLRYRRNGRR